MMAGIVPQIVRSPTMSDVTFEQVYELAKQLPSEEQVLLVESLQANWSTELDYGVTREQLLAEMEELKASGAFDNVESLYEKYANPEVDISFEDLQSYLHEIGTEWEKEIEEFFGDDTD
jgi:hypothetical protein